MLCVFRLVAAEICAIVDKIILSSNLNVITCIKYAEENLVKNCTDSLECGNRREFLVKSALAATGIVLSLSGTGSAFGIPFEDITVPIDDKSRLNKICGSVVVDSTAGKLIILRTGEAAFAAFSAKCTHKGGIVEFDPASRQFVCAKHGSRFDSTDGAVKEGPAESPIASYKAAGTSTSVTVTVGS